MAENISFIVTDVVPVMSKITYHKLDGSNYQDWSKTVRLYLRNIDKDAHLTDDPPEIGPKQKNGTCTSQQKEDLTWLIEDARLFLQI